MRKPCDNCPWRVDAPRGYWDPQHFIDIATNCRDDGLHVMLCHKANALPEERRHELPCQGWARVMGTTAIGVRIALMRGTLAVEEVADRGAPELFPTFGAMLRANHIKIPRRNRAVDVHRNPPRRK